MYDQRQFNKIKNKLHEILLTNLKKKKIQEAEKKRNKEASSRPEMHCLIKRDHYCPKIKCGSYRASKKKARTAAACPCFC